MDLTPERFSTAAEVVRSTREAGLARRADSAVYRHGLRAWERSQCDQIDSQTTRDAVECAFDEEVAFFDHAMHRADGSAVKQQLLAEKLELLSKANNRRIAHRFGR